MRQTCFFGCPRHRQHTATATATATAAARTTDKPGNLPPAIDSYGQGQRGEAVWGHLGWRAKVGAAGEGRGGQRRRSWFAHVLVSTLDSSWECSPKRRYTSSSCCSPVSPVMAFACRHRSQAEWSGYALLMTSLRPPASTVLCVPSGSRG